jgi:regulator of sigma E protease
VEGVEPAGGQYRAAAGDPLSGLFEDIDSRLLLFLTMLSANLAIVNFLPIPVLDGGHMVFLAYEGIFRRPVTEKVQVALTYAGLLFILGLMAFVIFLDVSRIKDWFF